MKLFTVVTTLTRAIVLAALAALAFACVQPADNTAPNNDTPQTIYYTVSFNAHGGIPAPQSQQTAKGQFVAPPPPPMTRAGYTFDGWYKDAAYTAPWNLASDTVSANITLHAKWNQDTVQPVYYTVSFNAAGGTPAPQNQTIAAGGTVSQPAAMTKANHTFGGWYTEAAYTTQWNFSVNTVNAALTLHAKWEADTSDKVLAVTLPGAGGVLTVPYGSNAAAVLDIGTDSAPYAGPETAPAEFQLAQDVKDALANAASISVNLKSSEAADISLAWVHYLRKATTDAKPGITITEVNADESKFTPVFSSTEWFNGSTSWETKNLYSQYKVSGAFVDSGREIIDLFNNHLNPPVIVYDATN